MAGYLRETDFVMVEEGFSTRDLLEELTLGASQATTVRVWGWGRDLYSHSCPLGSSSGSFTHLVFNPCCLQEELILSANSWSLPQSCPSYVLHFHEQHYHHLPSPLREKPGNPHFLSHTWAPPSSVNSASLNYPSVCRRHKRGGLNPWVRKIPWRRAWQLIPVFLPGESPRTEESGRLQSVGSPSQIQLKGLNTHTRALLEPYFVV